MINVSTAFRKKLYNDERDYINALRFTLTDGTVLNVGHEHIMSNGVEVDDAVGDDNSFTALGAVVCNSLTVILYNNDEIYSDYIFEGATCIYTTGLEVDNNGTLILETFQKGEYTVDSASYSDYTITLTLLDNMSYFDRPYDSQLGYPATLAEIVNDACTNCGVSLSTTSLRFPHYDYVVSTAPSVTDTTYREVLGWCATIAGCFARCNRLGDLELAWFNTNALENTSNDFDGGVFDSANPYATGDNVNGGTFNPWNTGDSAVADEFTVQIPYHYITDLSTQNIGVDDIIITGVSILVKTASDSNQDILTYSTGTSEFIIQIKDNPFITEATAQNVLNWLSTQLIGLRFRQCNVSHPNDPTIEAGDVGILWDKKGDQHNILITRVTFSPMMYQTVVCGAESIAKNQAIRMTETTKAYVETRKWLRQQKNTYDEAMDDLREEVENANGLYETQEVQADQSVITYLHNKPLLAESDLRIKISTAGVTVTPNGRDQSPNWYGLTIDGQFLASVINTISLFFDYAKGGTLTLGGRTNGNGIFKLYDGDNNLLFTLDNNGLLYKSDPTMTVPITQSYRKWGDSGFADQTIYMGIHGVQVYSPSFYDGSTIFYRRGVALVDGEIRFFDNNSNMFRVQGEPSTKRIKVPRFTIYGDSSDSSAIVADGGAVIRGDLSVTGNKNRIMQTSDYGVRKQSAYEMCSPMFGDIGSGITDENGECYVFIDPVFAQTVSLDNYYVFIQSSDGSPMEVSSKNSSYFVVKGKPSSEFAWEIKAKQLGYENYRNERYDNTNEEKDIKNYGEMATNYIAQLKEGRLSA